MLDVIIYSKLILQIFLIGIGSLAYFSEDDEDTAESSNQEEESEIGDSDDGPEDDMSLQQDLLDHRTVAGRKL